MDVRNILARLRKERDALDATIADLEGLGNERPGVPIRPNLVTKSATNGTNPGNRHPDPAPGEESQSNS